jgi:hypothetical protein
MRKTAANIIRVIRMTAVLASADFVTLVVLKWEWWNNAAAWW